MNSRCAALEQLNALLCGVFDAELGAGLVVVGALCQLALQSIGQPRPAQRREFLDLRRAADGNDARDDGDLDPQPYEIIAEGKVIGIVEKQLRDHEVGTAIDLVLEALPVDFLALLASDVSLGKSRHADAEAAKLPEQLHQLV